MGKGNSTRSAVKHQIFKDKAKTLADDLTEKFSDLQSARRESRTADVAVLEEQLHQMLREWKAELNQPSPASSLQGNTHASSDPPSETLRLLHLNEEEDDATSKLMELAVGSSGNLKPEPPEETIQPNIVSGVHSDGANDVYHEAFYINQADAYLYTEDYKSSMGPNNPSNEDDTLNQLLEQTCNLDYSQYLSFDHNPNPNPDGAHMSDIIPTICPPPSAFLRPKCALWDCPRPAQASEWCLDYCSTFHASVAMNECPPGMSPVIRPKGIDLKDGPLFAALNAKIQGKNVGIPVCEGAATAKSPWNAPELFDLSVLEGESIREWLFFDKPRRAFESGTRKQRSLPDYTGRGWHESRKQIMKEFGGLKRSYYMDPQPLTHFEWHLYEYEINDCDTFALYRLEFKVADAKKTAKQQLVRQNSENGANSNSPPENKRNSRGSRGKASNSTKDINENNQSINENMYVASSIASQIDQMAFFNENARVYGPMPYGYNMEKLDEYYGT
ncbi:Vascular plant one zinc finger protein [Rhynchospora pubera]|uniref:Vascular plant one zinc finger protein n=1 Tax=Rhynchospora pubera TaxID=906938 RepID=A0AAV8EPT9_9POAL|nr:Vascular plant one zinc finger protein [Rhynchospora pubera]